MYGQVVQGILGGALELTGVLEFFEGFGMLMNPWQQLKDLGGVLMGLGLGDDNQRLASALAGMWADTARTPA